MSSRPSVRPGQHPLPSGRCRGRRPRRGRGQARDRAGPVPAAVRRRRRGRRPLGARQGPVRDRLRDHLAAVPGPRGGQHAQLRDGLAGRARDPARDRGVRAARPPGALDPAALAAGLTRAPPDSACPTGPGRDRSGPQSPEARAAAGAVRAADRPGSTEASAPAARASTSTIASRSQGIVIETG